MEFGELENKSRDELIELAKEMGISNFTNLKKKQDIIMCLLQKNGQGIAPMVKAPYPDHASYDQLNKLRSIASATSRPKDICGPVERDPASSTGIKRISFIGGMGSDKSRTHPISAASAQL